MATSSSTNANTFFGFQVTEKLSKTNHALWRAQVLAAIRGARYEGHINGKTKAPMLRSSRRRRTARPSPSPTPRTRRGMPGINRFSGLSSLARERTSRRRSLLQRRQNRHGRPWRRCSLHRPTPRR